MHMFHFTDTKSEAVMWYHQQAVAFTYILFISAHKTMPTNKTLNPEQFLSQFSEFFGSIWFNTTYPNSNTNMLQMCKVM